MCAARLLTAYTGQAGCLPGGGVLPRRGCLPRGCLPVCVCGRHPPPRGQRDTCENITCASGNKCHDKAIVFYMVAGPANCCNNKKHTWSQIIHVYPGQAWVSFGMQLPPGFPNCSSLSIFLHLFWFLILYLVLFWMTMPDTKKTNCIKNYLWN